MVNPLQNNDPNSLNEFISSLYYRSHQVSPTKAKDGKEQGTGLNEDIIHSLDQIPVTVNNQAPKNPVK